uniref:VP4 n=1 Tax=Banna virus TaxID=77763 RepID=A0A3G2KX59_BANNV|nr:VP4 [Banna virus]
MAWVTQTYNPGLSKSNVISLTGNDRTVSDGTFNSMIMPKAVIANEREHFMKTRLDKIEHELSRNAKQEIADRQSLADDYKALNLAIGQEIRLDVATQHQLNRLGSAMYKADHERESELTDLINRIRENEVTVNGILENQKAITAAERADLVLEIVASTAKSVSAAGRAAADGSGVVPIFGPSVANGIKAGIDIADSVAEAAIAVKESGIVTQLNDVYHAFQSVHVAPNDVIKPAVAVANSSTELVGNLQAIYSRLRSHSDIGFKKVTVGDLIPNSYMIKPVNSTEYSSWQLYVVHPVQGSLGLVVQIMGDALTYNVFGQYGVSSASEFGKTVLTGGVTNTALEGFKVKFQTKVTAQQALSLVMALQDATSKLSQGEMIGYFEQYINLALEPDNLSLLENMHKYHHLLTSQDSPIDWNYHDEEMHKWLEARKNANRETMKQKEGQVAADIHIPKVFNDLRNTTMHCKLDGQQNIAGYTVYEYLIGPWAHQGDIDYSVVVETLSEETKWYCEIIGIDGHLILEKSAQHKPEKILELTVDDKGITQFKSKNHDRLKLKVYVKDALSVKVFRSWIGINVPRVKTKLFNDLVNFKYDYSHFDKNISPKHLRLNDLGWHTWDQYNNGNWTNIKA